MHSSKWTREDVFYLLAFGLALGVRLFHLGRAPLSNAEAELALRAWDLTRGALGDPGSQPAYVVLTSWLFSMVGGSSNFLARFWPALTGGLLALAPRFFREHLGRPPALILAFGLALDPGLVAVSRQADGRMMALGFALLALGLFSTRKPVWGGLFVGMALLSGPSIWYGLLGMGIAWGVEWLAESRLRTEISEGDGPAPRPSDWWVGAQAALLTLVIIGTRLFTFPAGLGSWGESLAAFLRGWWAEGGAPVERVLTALVFYQPLALIFAWVAPRGQRRAWAWFGTALVLALLYPARAVADLVWVLVPLWALAAAGLWAMLRGAGWEPIAWGQALAWLVLLSMAWLTLAGLDLAVTDTPLLRRLILPGVIVLGVLSTMFVGLGWSWESARQGTALGLLTGLGLYSLAMMSAAAYVRPSSPLELWATPPLTGQADLLEDTLRDLALRANGEVHTLEVVSLVDSPALRWSLRNIADVRFAPALGETRLPLVVLAPAGSEDNAWAAAYRGQDFDWALRPAWTGALPDDLLAWWTHRQAPVAREAIILWARADLFPATLATAEDQPSPETPEDVIK